MPAPRRRPWLAWAVAAVVASPETVVAYDCGFAGVGVRTESGHEVGGEVLVLANGYEMPPFVPARSHRILSTFALATVPQPTSTTGPVSVFTQERTSSRSVSATASIRPRCSAYSAARAP